MDLLLQNERRLGSPISILNISFELGNTVINIKLGKDRAIKMWRGDGPWEQKWGEVYESVLHECYVSDWDSSDCEVRDTPPAGNWLNGNKQKRRRTRRKRKTSVIEESTTPLPLPRLRLGWPEGPSRASARAHPKDQAFKTPCLWSHPFHRGGCEIASSYPDSVVTDSQFVCSVYIVCVG